MWRDSHSMPIELLCILDFYMLYPFLLHRASMPEVVRRDFREARILRDKDQFIQIPSAKSLYRDIALFQRTALSSLAAKSILDRESFINGTASLIPANVPKRLLSKIGEANEVDAHYMNFLVHKFGSIDLMGARGLRALTGLVRRQ